LPLLAKGLTTLGKSVLIAAGLGFGVVRGLRVLSESANLDQINSRIDSLNLAVAKLGDQAQQADARLNGTVTRTELSEALDRVFGKLEGELDERFDRQTRSVEALRVMVGQTDELLQKVLDGLESIGSDRDLAQSHR